MAVWAYLAGTRERLVAAGVRDGRVVELEGDPAARLLDDGREAGINLVVMSAIFYGVTRTVLGF